MTSPLLAVALAAALAPPPGAPPQARPRAVLSRVERSEVRLGEPFGYEIELHHAPGESYALAPDLDLPPFRGAGGDCRRAPWGDEVRTTCTLRLLLFALGPHEVPAVRLLVRTDRGEATLAVPGPRVTGLGILSPDAPAESLALRPLAPTVPLRVRSLRLVFWAAGVLAALAVAVLAWRVLGARARAVATPPPETPEARLRRRLDGLEAKRLAAKGLGREHFFELSGIVREWVGAVSGVNALDLTTAELCERLARATDPRVDVEALRRFGERADLVKYAREPAGESECAAATEWARGLGERGAWGASTATATSTSTSTPTPTPTPTSTSTSTRRDGGAP